MTSTESPSTRTENLASAPCYKTSSRAMINPKATQLQHTAKPSDNSELTQLETTNQTKGSSHKLNVTNKGVLYSLLLLASLIVFVIYFYLSSLSSTQVEESIENNSLSFEQEQFTFFNGYFRNITKSDTTNLIAYGYFPIDSTFSEMIVTNQDNSQNIRIAENNISIKPLTWGYDGLSVIYIKYKDSFCEVWRMALSDLNQPQKHTKLFICDKNMRHTGTEVQPNQFVFSKKGFRGTQKVYSLYRRDNRRRVPYYYPAHFRRKFWRCFC